MTPDPLAAEAEVERAPASEHRVRRVVRVRGVAADARVWPLVQDLAAELVLAGHGHDENGTLVLEVQGAPDDVERFAERVSALLPARPGAPEVTTADAPAEAGGGFVVAGAPLPGPPPLDLGVCPACHAELTDRENRRYKHPFTACADCGPRASLVTGPSADREHSTMSGFQRCQACAKEDADPKDRRYRALATSCPDCGPLLEYVESGSNAKAKPPVRGAEAMARARGMLRGGAVVAIKGPGGYHLACDATNAAAVRRLRTRREQGDRPFTLLVADVEAARAFARLDPEEAALLASPRRPVVLVQRRPVDGDPDFVKVVDDVAPNLHEWGVMLPPSALHVLLLGLPEDPPGPRVLVLTSAGRSDEPMLTDDTEAFDRLVGVADAWLRHDREIGLPVADSVLRVVEGRVVPVRWGRGYTPMPLALPVAVEPSLALGGDRDNAICLAEGHQAWLSGQTGTIDEHSTQRAFERTIPHLQTLAGLVPTTLVADTSPAYRSSQWAVREVVRRVTDGGPRPALSRVQQQHAHVAGVMADNGLDGGTPVIGVAFGGLGFQAERELWGGEVLIADYDGYHRFARLATIAMPGDEEIVLQRPYRSALAHMAFAGIPWDGRLLAVAATPPAERELLGQELATVLTTQTSSLRLLVDAVASITGVCHVAQYDGQAMAQLETVARAGLGQDHVAYSLPLMEGPAGQPRLWDPRQLVTTIAKDIAGGAPARIVAVRFHRALALAVVEAARLARRETLIRTVALSGELFSNVLLQRMTTKALRSDGFEVLWHRRVPPGDACLALGQLMIGARSA